MPAVVLLDINMPGLDGFEVLQRIREREAFAQLPVIMMLTNSDNPRDIERAAELGANGFQTKPATMKEYVRFFDSLAP
jgi:CheY-like chemotaxis protein